MLGISAFGAGPVAAGADHTTEKFTEHVGPFPTQFGLNPCTGMDDAGMLELWVSGESEVEDGREHTSLSILGVAHTASGFVAAMQEEDEANIADGNGTVDITGEWEIATPAPATTSASTPMSN